MSDRLFQDRRDAGRALVGRLERYRDTPDVIVVGLPRGGVPVAYEIAMALDAPLDTFLVRKLGAPGREELAMGAIASGGVIVLNEDVIQGMKISPEVVQETAEREGRELLRREKTYREGRLPPDFTGRTVIVVDDGLATGASMRAAVEALRRHRPAAIVVAVPAAPESTCREIGAMADKMVCATTPSPFLAVGRSYWDFDQTTDEEVQDLLRTASRSRPAGTGAQGSTEVAAVRLEALPTEEGVPRGEDLFELVGDARFVLIGEASHGTHEFYEARAAHDAAADRGEGLLRGGGGGRLARRLPGEPVRPRTRRRRDRRGGAARLRAFPDVDVAQHGRAGLRRVAARAQRRAGRDERPRRASTDWTSTACTGPSTRSSPSWNGSIRGPRHAPGSATPASITTRRRRPVVRLRRRVRGRRAVRAAGGRAAGRPAAPRAGVRPAGRDPRRRTSSSTRSRARGP